ncbi:hypothetical protein F7725_023432 [Dissostichus mawsoni]|uniref:Uncharacterized protein n=1 Tax=Dissostichus mawsoni TaxID=36200 RepID=A0A7J5Z3L7_DISMA|nr:hypothetical protein F7725_023432 [Dissostichus mawsoni]
MTMWATPPPPPPPPKYRRGGRGGGEIWQVPSKRKGEAAQRIPFSRRRAAAEVFGEKSDK